MQRLVQRLVVVIAVVGFFAACDHPNPLAPATPIGEFPQWGIDFTVENKAGGATLFSPDTPGPAPSDDPNNATASGGGGTAVPAANPNKVKMGGGDVKYGQQLFMANCARCHGPAGAGGEMPMIGLVPNLTDKGWHGKVTDAQIASSIVHGKGKMPSFMGQLDKRELDSVVAFLRSIKGE